MSEEHPATAVQETKATKEAKEARAAQEAAGPLHAEEAEEARAAGAAKAAGRAKAPRGGKKSATDRAAKGAKGKGAAGAGVEPAAPLDWSNPLRDPQDRRLPRIAGPSGLVIFGVTGDLSRRKLMPAVYDLANRGLLPPGFSLVGFARRDWEDQDFAQVVHDAVKEHARTPFREEVWQQLSEGMRFIPGDFDDDNAFEQLRKAVEELDASRGTSGNYAFYLSVPPKFFPKVVQQLKKHGLTDAPDGSWRRAVIEKPFGHDLDSARDLNALVHEVFDPEQVFRIDHYLGKETVQNILALRFANQMYEPIWNRSYVDHVQITMAEDIGIGGRAGYYDGIGAARDVIQNHLLQLMALTAMEEPAAFDARSLLTEKLKVLRAVRLPDDLGDHTVRGQYAGGWQGGAQVPGYLEEEGIDPASTTDTYAAIKLGVDNRRWAGVPFYLRTGKRLGRRVTEIAVVFQRAPHSPFDSTATEELGENAIVIRVQPDEGMTVRFGSKVPGTSMEIRDVSMDFAYGESFTESSPEAYERLILDVLLGDANLFPRHQEVEESWRILDPIEEYWASHDKPAQYASGGWGPREADEMLARDGRSWRRP
ncbi:MULTISPECIES: glucose-6-phosphate dehydrogenase [Streptomyces]|uniref:glucose-6-phosphate dehydrogenase n=1 Tax=Streptomyces TaxID=1883 RepID=UPI00129131E3|nr:MULTISPECIES: glucose-6-phosphate dehydrogenase [Streptomyces]MCX5040622.1 glucose-6-phosphate dehydrogenase [Streptomyces coelicoflavus]QFX80486.1 glucose-6-phosphate dehydrogenase [Streptomyces sp. SYP-A7193]